MYNGREIEFRGKRLDNGKWVYGWFYMEDENTAVIVNKEEGNLQYTGHEVDPDTVGQFTGLTDKNGKKIYEKDIVRFLDGDNCSSECGFDWSEIENIGVIKWEQQYARFIVTRRSMIDLETFFEEIQESEVIGNTVDNPELLEAKL